MSEPTTPGQVNYAAYWQCLAQPPATILLTRLAWGEIYPAERDAWEAAAQAVLDAHAKGTP